MVARKQRESKRDKGPLIVSKYTLSSDLLTLI